jgi:hypothetical protein
VAYGAFDETVCTAPLGPIYNITLTPLTIIENCWFKDSFIPIFKDFMAIKLT